MLACASLLVYGFGFILVMVAIWIIVDGVDRRDRGQIARGAALGLGAAAGMGLYAKRQKEEEEKQRQLDA